MSGTKKNKIKIAGRKLLWLLILMPLVVVAGILLLPPLPSSPMMRDSFWAHKVNSVDCFDIVYTGDSRVYRGVDPGVVESMTGFKGFNFGFSSADVDSFLLTEAAARLSPNGRRILVVGLSANSFLEREESNAHLKSLLRITEKDLWIRINLYPKLTMFDHRAVSDLYKYLKGEHYDEVYHLETGFAVSDKTPADTTEALPLYKAEFAAAKFSVKKLEAFKRCLAHLQKQGISVVLMRMPVTNALQKLEAQYAPELEAYWHYAEYHDQHTFNGWGTYTTYDGSHLNSGSAHHFSRDLSVYLKGVYLEDVRQIRIRK
jgi:hypothetical protein